MSRWAWLAVILTGTLILFWWALVEVWKSYFGDLPEENR